MYVPREFENAELCHNAGLWCMSAGMVENRRFWENALRLPFGQQHPGLVGIADYSFVLPIQHHADGATFMNKIEYNIFSMSSAMTCGNSFDTKFPIAILETERFIDGVTEREIVDYITWCQTVLQSGTWPMRGYRGERFSSGYRYHHMGESLAGPWIGAFAFWKGDLKAKVKTHGFKARNYGSNWICEHCSAQAKVPSLSWRNFGDRAPWRSTRVIHELYLMRPPETLSRWLSHPGPHPKCMSPINRLLTAPPALPYCSINTPMINTHCPTKCRCGFHDLHIPRAKLNINTYSKSINTHSKS